MSKYRIGDRVNLFSGGTAKLMCKDVDNRGYDDYVFRDEEGCIVRVGDIKEISIEVIEAWIGPGNEEYNPLYKEIFTPLLFPSYNDSKVNGWKVIDKKINSCDEEDGGAHYDIVIKREKDGAFFSTNYCDWGENDLQCTFTQVFAKEKTIIYYE